MLSWSGVVQSSTGNQRGRKGFGEESGFKNLIRGSMD